MESPDVESKSDLKVVLQFFIVPLSLVAVLVSLFFGLQFLRQRRPNPEATLRSLQHYDGFLGAVVGDLKRWQSGYDLSLLLRAQSPDDLRRMVPELTAALRDAGARRDLKLRRYLTLALGYAGDPRGVAPLGEALRDDDPETRLNAAWGLVQTGSDQALPDLHRALQDADPGVRKMAAYGLGARADHEAATALRAALADPEIDVGWNAALALARIGDRAAIPTLRSMLDRGLAPRREGENDRGTGAGELALNAVRALALLLPDQEAKAQLERAAASSDAAARDAALAALQGGGASAAKGVAVAAPSEIR
jgi:hypothetical protein